MGGMTQRLVESGWLRVESGRSGCGDEPCPRPVCGCWRHGNLAAGTFPSFQRRFATFGRLPVGPHAAGWDNSRSVRRAEKATDAGSRHHELP
jgi:hypothetical protein